VFENIQREFYSINSF